MDLRNSPPAVQADVAPCGYSVLHVHRPLIHGGPTRGGGLAIIHSESVAARSIALPISTPSSSCKAQVDALDPASHQTVLINIYRPPSSSVPVFLDEHAGLITAFGVQVPGKLVLYGDLNCPGTDGSHVDDDVASLLDTFSLHQHACEPTRGANLLDILALEDVLSVSNLVFDDAGLISDHRLIIASVRLCLPARHATPYMFRDIKNVNHSQFEQALYSSELFTAPTSTFDAHTEQHVSVVTRKLDLVAPVQTRNKRCPKDSSKWLSPEPICAMSLRRRLARCWKTSGLDTNRTTYRAACRMVNKAINESRRSQHRQRISECVDSKQRWDTIKNILHSCDSDNSRTEDENLKLCHSFADFFVNKINDLKKTIEARLLLLQGPVFQDIPYSGTPLQNLPLIAPS